MDMSTNLSQGSEYDLNVTTGYGDVHIKVWIDLNDNFLLEDDEAVVEDYIVAPGETGGTYTETIPLNIPGDANLGEHLFRIKANYNEAVPSDPCEESLFGETEDYVVNVVFGTGINSIAEPNDLLLINKGNNHFGVEFYAVEINKPLILTVHNLQGQTVIQNRVQNENGKYTFDFNMSYAPTGIYLLRLGNDQFGKIKRFVVK